MKAAVCSKNGPPSVLRYEEIPDPQPGSRDVLIRVQAISIEGGDVLNRRLLSQTTAPHVVGYQAAGVVQAIGREVQGVSVGQRVVGFNWAGSHAELFAVPEHFVYPVPDQLDIKIAATIPVTFGTADDSLFEFGKLAPGETVLIRGGTGGVGIAAIQLAKAAGAVVLATTSNDRHRNALAALGADHVINYKTHDLAQSVTSLTHERGADLVVDLVGGSYVSTLIKALKYRARVSVVGIVSPEPSTISFLEILSKSLSFNGLLFGQEMHLPRVHRMLARHFDAVAAGPLKMPIDRTFALSEAAAAHAHVEDGHPFGRVLILP